MDVSSSEFIDVDVNVSSSISYTILECKSNLNNLYLMERMGKRFVLKTLKPEFASQSMYRSLLNKEFDLMAKLNHPNIVHFLSLEDIPNLGVAIVMEYIDGVTLKDFLATNPNDKVRHKIIFELLDALNYMHSKQIIHRDIKPSNILITHNGNNVKIIDFGLSDSDDYTVFKVSSGTLAYASPEQLTPNSIVDNRTDIFSFGKILQLLFPTKYSKIAKQCLNENPEKRLQSAANVANALRAMPRNRNIIIALFALISLIVLLSCLFLGYVNRSVEPLVEKYEEEVVNIDIKQNLINDLYAIYQPITEAVESGDIKYYEIASAHVDKTIPKVFELINHYESITNGDSILLGDLKTTWNVYRMDILREVSTKILTLPFFSTEYAEHRITEEEYLKTLKEYEELVDK